MSSPVSHVKELAFKILHPSSSHRDCKANGISESAKFTSTSESTSTSNSTPATIPKSATTNGNGTMSKGRLAGKVALITGASRGIGRATALAFAREGASIVVNYAGNAAAAKTVVGEIEQLGTSAIAIQADVGNMSHYPKLFEQTVSSFQHIDILVLNAGLLVGDKDLASTKPEDFDRTFNVNVKGPYFMTQVSLSTMDNWLCSSLLLTT